ncbi:hypothetical protein CNBB2910 [Cryptococcus deneoformans B-3501A]|uniref:Expressed protein n=1 Tax=Cryptococcus deneoformans (strain JEC21 / ATCC MYA-565) TaxID=214684 RepID=Q5KM66_CRYD1|nr:expressed protein [Cryptococcus neoformans var. neoformans JEC21]XP_777059.1 hypothetical protein CNBB2910 [Cryptococcus neoformans var. neoformans B-3501A]AAW41559.1 expressed protein [Cryptococcus neoformans var. neoformans JEC21]EAL22412.1 hypothetical protein CNBB2910 [Cryptococcus neoformans var. neoformans B-3501A]
MFTKAAIVVALAGTVNAALSINTPASLIECQPAALSWSGGSSTPYYLAVLPGGQVSATALENIDTVDTESYTWTVNLASGTNITIRVTDGSGNIAYSSPVVIQEGSSSSCLTSSSSSSATAAAGSSSGDSSASTTASGSSASSGSSGSSASTTASGSSASASSSSSSSDSGALLTKGNAGVAASLVGIVAAAFAAVA